MRMLLSAQYSNDLSEDLTPLLSAALGHGVVISAHKRLANSFINVSSMVAGEARLQRAEVDGNLKDNSSDLT